MVKEYQKKVLAKTELFKSEAFVESFDKTSILINKIISNNEGVDPLEKYTTVDEEIINEMSIGM